ncbi:MAG: serine--tRNA ligase [Patescibacteria group bacterium]
MLDIQFIRENKDLVAEKSLQKGYKVDIDKLLEFDKKRKSLLQKIEKIRADRNELVSQTKGQKPTDQQMVDGRMLKENLSKLESDLAPIDEEYLKLLKQVPNMPTDDVPVGKSEDDNVVVKEVGQKPQFDFEPKSHWQIGEAKDWIDKERASKVSGSRFAYIKGNLARLQFAIIQYVIDTLTDEKVIQDLIKQEGLNLKSTPFTLVLPPAMIKTSVFDAMDRLEPQDDRYRVGEDGDDLWLQGSAEHTIGSMHLNEILSEKQMPIRYLGYSSSFRREAGTYGKDTEGLIRMHQFDKLEMEVFSSPETGIDEHKLLIAIQEYLMRQLNLPYHVLMKCTADIGKPNVRGVDIDAWMPAQNKYRETHTADYMSDYQTRRLKTRIKKSDGKIELAHTNDATAFALGRTMAVIIENYQNKEGNVNIPEVLKKYLPSLGDEL